MSEDLEIPNELYNNMCAHIKTTIIFTFQGCIPFKECISIFV